MLNLQPLHPQALEDYARLQLKLGRKQEVMQQLQASAEAAKGKPESLPIGLLLADVQQRNGLNGEATATYQGSDRKPSSRSKADAGFGPAAALPR